MPKVGDTAPDFTLSDQDGNLHTLSAYRGKWVLLYFYPKDDTTGCTKEAYMIRDIFPRFERAKAQVFGVSIDGVQSHKKFAEKYALPFPLLADSRKKAVQLYGVWGEKQFMRRKYTGTKRISFLIDPKDVVKKVYENVQPDIHAKQVLTDLEELGA